MTRLTVHVHHSFVPLISSSNDRERIRRVNRGSNWTSSSPSIPSLRYDKTVNCRKKGLDRETAACSVSFSPLTALALASLRECPMGTNWTAWNRVRWGTRWEKCTRNEPRAPLPFSSASLRHKGGRKGMKKVMKERRERVKSFKKATN